MLETVRATRFALPLREGGSMPALVEASDEGMYVVKLRGAGQGLKVLVAEVIVGELARALGIDVPRLAVVDLPEALARYEADEEVQDLLRASIGTNLGLDFLPGSLGYDGSTPPSPEQAAAILWLDALTLNVDRTWANPNLLLWHGRVVAIDHGAALYFHHAWPSKAPNPERVAAQAFDASTHVLREVASGVAGLPGGDPAAQRRSLGARMRATHDRLAPLVPQALAEALADVPDEWLETTPWLDRPEAVRQAYLEVLTRRLANPEAWLPAEVEVGIR